MSRVPTTVESAGLADRTAAFRLIFRELPPEERDLRLATALQLIDRRELDPAGLLVARGGDEVIGAMLCQVVPGATGLVWPPQTRPSACQAACEDLLVRHAAAWLTRQGAKLGQALLSPREVHLAPSLARNGFTRITQLWNLRRSCRPSDQALPAEDGLVLQSYDGGNQDLFHQTLLQTYGGTLDCPEVNGVREVGEIITGHRSQGTHDPARWWLALNEGRPVGVLLMTEMPEWGSLDVSYVGVVPGERRRGAGRAMMHRALAEAQAAGFSQVTLSVDERNRPAWDLYRGLGFDSYDQREVYLAIWKRAESTKDTNRPE